MPNDYHFPGYRNDFFFVRIRLIGLFAQNIAYHYIGGGFFFGGLCSELLYLVYISGSAELSVVCGLRKIDIAFHRLTKIPNREVGVLHFARLKSHQRPNSPPYVSKSEKINRHKLGE